MATDQTGEESRVNSPGLPPSYEQALGHRRIECSSLPAAVPSHSESQEETQGTSSEAPVHNRFPRRRSSDVNVFDPGARSRPSGANVFAPGTHSRSTGGNTFSTQSRSSTVNTFPVLPQPVPSAFRLTADGDNDSVVTTDHDLDDGCVRLLLPPMHICMATTCLFCNILVPGLGTLLAALGVFCCTRCRDWSCSDRLGSCCCSIIVALLQVLLTPVILIGWIWSILWGFAYVAISQQEYHGHKPATVSPLDPHSIQLPAPPSYEEATAAPAPPLALPVRASVPVAEGNGNNRTRRSATEDTNNTRDELAEEETQPESPVINSTSSQGRSSTTSPSSSSSYSSAEPDSAMATVSS